MLVKIKIKEINKEIKVENDTLLKILPELVAHLKIKEIGLKNHLLYYLKNKDSFKDIKYTIKELEQELSDIQVQEREGWIKPPLEAIKQEKKTDKDCWRNYKWLP